MRDDSDSRVSIQESTATTSSSRSRLSRRRFLEATAAATAIASVSGIAAAQDGGTETPTPTPTDGGGGGGQVAQTFELGGETAGWQGRSPSSIEGQTNPTLQLEAGQTYEITWENVDGASHNIAILDSNGNELESTEIMNQQGQTQTLTFQATEEMAEYYCAVHPQSMRGQVNLGGGGGGTGTETGTPTPTEEGTPTPTEEATPTPTEEASPTPAGDGGDGGGGGGGATDQPGFGVIAALSGLAGAGAYLRRRMKRDEK